jgi:hypothetical protein
VRGEIPVYLQEYYVKSEAIHDASEELDTRVSGEGRYWEHFEEEL